MPLLQLLSLMLYYCASFSYGFTSIAHSSRIASSCSSTRISCPTTTTTTTTTTRFLFPSNNNGASSVDNGDDDNIDDQDEGSSRSRRDFLESAMAAGSFSAAVTLASTAAATTAAVSPAFAESMVVSKEAKVLVLGGTGFVGSRVVEKLKSMNVDVIATSRDGRDGTVAFDIGTDPSVSIPDQVKRLAQGCTAVISCIGSIGNTETDNVVNSGTGLAAMGAKAAGSIERFVYITVAPEVQEFAKDIDFLKGYMEGKTFSRDAVLKSFGDKAVLIEPTFIYGGGSFELNPPRVASFYGKFVEGLLSSSPIRAVDRVLSPGFIKIALEPPVPVDAVADAAIAGALGVTPDPIIDTYDKIKDAAKLL